MPTDCETISPEGRTARSDYSEVMRRFEQAIAAYKAQADPLTLLLLNKSAIPLMDAQEHAWQSMMILRFSILSSHSPPSASCATSA